MVLTSRSDAFKRYLIYIVTAAVILGAFTSIGGAIWLVHRDNIRETQALTRNNIQIRFIMFIICRSEGRSIKNCKKEASTVRLPPDSTLEQLEARFVRMPGCPIGFTRRQVKVNNDVILACVKGG